MQKDAKIYEDLQKLAKESKKSESHLRTQLDLELRRRTQAEYMLNYVLCSAGIFDYFTFDAFQIVLGAKYAAENVEIYSVTTEFLLLPFYTLDLPITPFLEKYNVNFEPILNYLEEINSLQKPKDGFFLRFIKKKTKQIWQKIDSYIQNNEFLKYFFIDPVYYDKNISDFSEEMESLIHKSIENASERFKTPVISPEILFITIMEEKDSRAGKIVNTFFENETKYQLLRYQLIKLLHKQEAAIKNGLQPHQHIYAYLLKTQLPEEDFNKLIDRNLLDSAVTIFRNNLISDLLAVDFFGMLEAEINITTSRNRKYKEK
jgi:hypothetical protein